MFIDIIDPANQIDLGKLDPVLFRLLEQFAQGTDRVFVNQFEGDLRIRVFPTMEAAESA